MLRTIDTPIGPLLLTADADGLSRVDFGAVQSGRNVAVQSGHNEASKVHSGQSGEENRGTDKRGAAILDAAEAQLAEYFAGTRREFDLPLNPAPTTEFRALIHAQLDTIGYGEVASYGELALLPGRSAPPAVPIPCRLSGPATACCAAMERLAVMPAASISSVFC